MRNTYYIIIAAIIIAGLSSCESDDTLWDIVNQNSSSSTQEDEELDESSDIVTYTSSQTSNAVDVVYDGSSATVTVSSDIESYIKVYGTGAKVKVIQSSNLKSEVTYTLSGTSTKGAFYMDGAYDMNLVFNSLTLTNADSAAVNIQDGKLINISLVGTSTLTDGSSSSDKGALVLNGHSKFSGSGTLNVAGNANHAIWADEYIVFESSMTGTVNITKASVDGINVNEHFEQNGGTISIANVGDEGLQVSAVENDEEETGYATISGGTLSITAGSSAGKGFKTDGDITINGGNINITASGSEGMESEAYIYINGGSITVNSYDDCINAQKDIYINDGNVTVISSNNDGIDANNNLYVKGGTVMAFGGSGAECGLDAAEGYNVYLTAGNVLALGGSSFSTSSSSQPIVTTTGSATANTTIALYNGSTELVSFTVPSNYTSKSNSGMGGMGGSSGSYSISVSCAGLTSGNSYTLINNGSSTTVTASTGSSGGSHGGFGGR